MTTKETKRRLEPLTCPEFILRLGVPLVLWVNLVRPSSCPTRGVRLERCCLTLGEVCVHCTKACSPCNPALHPCDGGPFPHLSHGRFPTRRVWVVSSCTGNFGRCVTGWWWGKESLAGPMVQKSRPAALFPHLLPLQLLVAQQHVLFQGPHPHGAGWWQAGRGQPCRPTQAGAAGKGRGAERR